jgi:hypothetical protein
MLIILHLAYHLLTPLKDEPVKDKQNIYCTNVHLEDENHAIQLRAT